MGALSEDAMAGDMSAVATAAKLDRFALLGISQGCATPGKAMVGERPRHFGEALGFNPITSP